MPLPFRKGDEVAQNVTVITGTVKDVQIVDGEPQYVVEYKDAEGDTHERTFKEDEIKKVE